MNEREHAIQGMRRKHSALARIEADIKAGALAGARRAAKKALNETRLALTPVEFDEVVRRAMEELRREVAREFDVRDRRITNALAELIPLLDAMRSVARGAGERDPMLVRLTLALVRWRRRYEANDTAKQIVSWLVEGDHEPGMRGPKKRAEGIAYKVIARLPWIGSITPKHVQRIYRQRECPRLDGWWLKLAPKLSEPMRSSRRTPRPLVVPGARRRSRRGAEVWT